MNKKNMKQIALYESIMASMPRIIKSALSENKMPMNLSDDESITDDRTDPAFTQYLRDISHYPVGLSYEEWCDVYDTLHDPDATEAEKKVMRDKAINANLRYVIKVVKYYRKSGQYCNIPMSDLVQAGNIGIAKAVDKFDPRKSYEKDGETQNVKFTTYATRWIQREIFEMFDRDSGIGSVSQTVTLMNRAIKRIQSAFYVREERMPNNLEIFDALKEKPEWENLTWKSFMQTIDAMQKPDNLDDTTANDEGDTISKGAKMASGTFERPGSSLDKEDMARRLKEEMTRVIGERWANLMLDKYGVGRPDGIGMTDTELMDKYGVGRPMINQMLREKPLKLAKDPVIKELLAEYMS